MPHLSQPVDVHQDLQAFHNKFDLTYEGDPRFLPKDLQEFRLDFLYEELDEYEDAIAEGNLEKAFDSLVDLVVVAVGTADFHGFDFNEGWRRVMAANMKKVRGTAENSKRKSGYDVVKPDGWEAPDLSDLVQPR